MNTAPPAQTIGRTIAESKPHWPAPLISWSGLYIGRDRSSPVGDYAAPFAFTGLLRKVTVEMDHDQRLYGDAVGRAEMAWQ